MHTHTDTHTHVHTRTHSHIRTYASQGMRTLEKAPFRSPIVRMIRLPCSTRSCLLGTPLPRFVSLSLMSTYSSNTLCICIYIYMTRGDESIYLWSSSSWGRRQHCRCSTTTSSRWCSMSPLCRAGASVYMSTYVYTLAHTHTQTYMLIYICMHVSVREHACMRTFYLYTGCLMSPLLTGWLKIY